jgi:hypothetical protein
MFLLRRSRLALGFLVAAACSSGAVQPGDPRPDVVVATVVAVEPPSAFTRVLVDTAGRSTAGGAAAGNPAPRFYLIVSGETVVVVRRAGFARRGASARSSRARACAPGAPASSSARSRPSTRPRASRSRRGRLRRVLGPGGAWIPTDALQPTGPRGVGVLAWRVLRALGVTTTTDRSTPRPPPSALWTARRWRGGRGPGEDPQPTGRHSARTRRGS